MEGRATHQSWREPEIIGSNSYAQLVWWGPGRWRILNEGARCQSNYGQFTENPTGWFRLHVGPVEHGATPAPPGADPGKCLMWLDYPIVAIADPHGWR
jgi:hypothetical protein